MAKTEKCDTKQKLLFQRKRLPDMGFGLFKKGISYA